MAVLLVAGLAASCSRPHSDCSDPHDAHAPKATLTAYGQALEVYCEADPLVVGASSQVLVHLTRLSDFKPLMQGQVSATLMASGAKCTAQADTLSRPGVCTLILKPAHTGKGTLTVAVQGTDGIREQVTLPVQVYASTAEASKAMQETAPRAGGNTVAFSKEMGWKSHFGTQVCHRGPFGPAFRVLAQVQPAQGEEHEVAAQMSGIVRLGDKAPVEGMEVRAGQALFTVDGSSMAEGNQSVRFQEAEAAYRKAKAELERREPLAKDRIVSQADLQATRAEYESARAQYESMKRLCSHGRQVATAPTHGYVAQVNVRDGQYVEEGQTMVTLSSTRWLTLRALVPQQMWSTLPHISDARLRLQGADTLTTLRDLDGTVLSYARQVSASQPLLPVLFRVRYTPALLPGSWVEMYVQSQTECEALTVPVESIVEEMGLRFVYVQLTPELFEKREVTTGGTDGVRTEVLTGLKDGERVVASGAVLVKLTQASGGVDPHAGHMH